MSKRPPTAKERRVAVIVLALANLFWVVAMHNAHAPIGGGRP